MLNNELLAIAVDLETTIDMSKLESKLATDGDTLVIIRTDGYTANVIVSDHFADMPPVDVRFHTIPGANGSVCVQDFWIRLNLSAKELYTKLSRPVPQSDTLFFVEPLVKVYVDVVVQDDFYINIQTAHTTVYEGGPARS